MLDEKRVSRLRGPERVALKQMQKIADKCNMSGTTRVEKVMMVLDDLRYNSRLTDKHGDKKRKGAFTSFVIRKQGDTGTCAEYLQVMLTALDIPCHTYDAYWMSRNMVQLDNGKWYLIKGNMSGLEVVAMPENDVNMPEFPALADVCDVDIPTYASAVKFWAAAEKAFAEGAWCMGARVKKYPGARMFKEAYKQHLTEGGIVVPAEMYLPSDEGKSRYACVSFAQPEEVVSPEENPFEIKPEVNEARKKFRKLYED
ncbi:MAG: hypothetical protein IKA23_08915 [Akkermansia sp.]|nr:hypothetical protein [Akkermansia sp.]